MATLTGMNMPVLASLPIFICFAMVVTPIGNVAVKLPHPEAPHAPRATGNKGESGQRRNYRLPLGSLGVFLAPDPPQAPSQLFIVKYIIVSEF